MIDLVSVPLSIDMDTSIFILRETGTIIVNVLFYFIYFNFFFMFSYILRFIDIQMVYSIYLFKVWGSSASDVLGY